MRLLVTLVVVGMGLVPVPSTNAATSLPTSVIEEFDAVGADWFVVSGSASLSQVSSPRTSGTGAMRVAYDLSSSSQAYLSSRRSPPDLPGLPRSLSLDVNGDKSWNVLYLQVQDSTGEIFHYRLGNLDFTGWRTLSFELGRGAPAASFSGDHDGILDLPVRSYRIVVDRNPGSSVTKGAITVDRMVATYEPWTPLQASPRIFVPSAGQRTTVRLALTEAGSFQAILSDGTGRSRTWTGAAKGGGTPVSMVWDGTNGAGDRLTGSVSGRLSITRGGTTWRYDIPYLAGLPVRYEPESPGSIVGINSTMSQQADRSKAEQQARSSEAAYVRMARESFEWNRVEPRDGWFEWSRFDQTVEVAKAHNIEILGTLGPSAAWASSAPGSLSPSERQYYPPTDMGAFADYVTAVVHRYKDRVHHWEIWNEEDSATFWRPKPDATAYARLLKVAYAAIKAEDPSATVLIGGLVGTDLAFLDGIIAAGAWGAFDALALHLYTGGPPETSMFATWLENARAYVDRHGAKPIWITEFGWSTYSGSGSGYVGVSESAQADYLARAYLHAARVGVRGAFAFELMERSTSTTSRLDNYGLIRTDGSPKAAYSAVRRIAEALDGGVAAGAADPDATTRVTVDGLESPAAWKAQPLGGGTATLTGTTTRHGGTSAIRLAYGFTSSSTGVELRRNLVLPGKPTKVSIWVQGDGSANPVYLKLTDATGETFQGAVGTLQNGWQRLVLFADGADVNWKSSGGDGDGRFDYPLTLTSVFVFRAGIGVLSGSAVFDDIQVESGPRVRGVVVVRRGGIAQSLYMLAPASDVSVPISGSRAWLVDGSSSTSLGISSGRVKVRIGSRPVNILSSPAVVPPSISPDGDGLNDSARMSWISGDRSLHTFQVLTATGKVLRTIHTDAWSDAGLRSDVWDGLVGGSVAGAGSYRLRLAVRGPDGRTAYLAGDVEVGSSVKPAPGPSLSTSRLAGPDRYATAVAISAATFPAPPVPVAYVATGANFPDALAGGPAAAHQGGPVLLVTRDGIPPVVATELARLAPARIVVLGGPSVVSSAVVEALAAYTSGSVVRLAGLDRYATSGLVARTIFAGYAGRVYIAAGTNFPDALAGGPAAAAIDGPLVLASANDIPDPSVAALRALNPTSFVLLGGLSVLGDGVVTEIKARWPGVPIGRWSGSDRYATSAEISANAFPLGADTAFLATGTDFPDALAGVPAAGLAGGPLLLTRRDCLPPVVSAELERLDPSRLIILGGPSVVAGSATTTICAH